MVSPELERLWKDPRNWSFPGIYRCAQDPRVIVPKSIPWAGWTINFAHRKAWLVLAGLVLIAVGPTIALILLVRHPSPATMVITMIASVVFLIVVCIRASEGEQ